MAGPLALAAVPLVGKLIDRALSFIPDPEAREKARAAMEADTREAEMAFRQFVLEYEGRGDNQPLAIQLLRSSVRPVMTYGLAGAFVYGFLNPDAVDDRSMSMLFNMNLISLGFWYGERALKNLGFNVTDVLSARRSLARERPLR